jgi:hypothetical protein
MFFFAAFFWLCFATQLISSMANTCCRPWQLFSAEKNNRNGLKYGGDLNTWSWKLSQHWWGLDRFFLRLL